MEALNSTKLLNYSPQEMLQYSHSLTTKPALLILFIAMNLIFLLIGIAFLENKFRFIKIWFLIFFMTGIVFSALYFLPNFTQYIASMFGI